MITIQVSPETDGHHFAGEAPVCERCGVEIDEFLTTGARCAVARS